MEIRKAGLLGGGVIGGGWAARFALNGVDVTVFDPDPEAERKIEAVMENARRAVGKLVRAPLPKPGTVRVVDTIAEAAAGADFIQESAPEREDLKRALLAEASRAANPDVIIASSTSGLLPSCLQADCVNPERLCVGHPFNPVYLLPLVEVVGGNETTPETKDRAADIYRSLGMHPLIVRKEVDAFLSDRLMEALWREALHLINDGVATTDEIDQAVCYGPGLRWSFMGTFLTYRLAGGEAGMRHFLHQFGPTLQLPWSKMEGPELSEDLIERIAEQSDDQAANQAAGSDLRKLERLRDDCLVSVIHGLNDHDHGAGAVLHAYERKLRQALEPDENGADRVLRLHSEPVRPEWIDYNGHLSEAYYVLVLSHATDALYDHLGMGPDYREDNSRSLYTVEGHVRYLKEVPPDVTVDVDTRIFGFDEKRIRFGHVLSVDGVERATEELIVLHVDTVAGGTRPMPQTVQDCLAELVDPAPPDWAGRSVNL